ncbi:hypothetical protein GJAV_G00018150 [Gymnothorax javanicus]|nr:hypothetical protein GJAV_G00018150 [Gymnothorax javanicus]
MPLFVRPVGMGGSRVFGDNGRSGELNLRVTATFEECGAEQAALCGVAGRAGSVLGLSTTGSLGECGAERATHTGLKLQLPAAQSPTEESFVCLDTPWVDLFTTRFLHLLHLKVRSLLPKITEIRLLSKRSEGFRPMIGQETDALMLKGDMPVPASSGMSAEELQLTLRVREMEVRNRELEVQAMQLRVRALELERQPSVVPQGSAEHQTPHSPRDGFDQPENGTHPVAYPLEDGVLLRKWSPGTGREYDVITQVVVPKEFRIQDHPTVGELKKMTKGSIAGGHVGPPLPTNRLLTVYRELLVAKVKNTQCLLDNLQLSGYFCAEDTEIVQRSTTKTEQVRKILELVQSKGEEASEYFVYILHEAYDAYIDLRPWFTEIQYKPSDSVREMAVINTDPISKYCNKLRRELAQDTRFITSYAQKEETLLEDLYIDTLMELLSEKNESLGYLDSLDELLGQKGVFNEHAETIFIIGDAGVGKSILLQKLQNLWSKRELAGVEAKFFFKFRCRMFSAFKEMYEISLRDLLFKHNCYPDGDLDDEVFSYILSHPETVLFTFDGYDELHADFDLDKLPEIVSPEEKAHPLMLLTNLLSGKLLKGSRKILTARTGTQIQSRVVRKKVYLKGFSPENLRRYTCLHFHERDFQKHVMIQLDANPHLCSLCSIPLFCWIIFKSFKHLRFMYDNFELPDTCVTLTNVFLLLCEVFLGRSSGPGLLKRSTRCPADTFRGGARTLAGFAKLALLGMEKGGFVLSQDEVSSCGITAEDLQLGFLRPLSDYDSRGNPATYEFLHMTLQSFLSAFSLVLDENIFPREILKFFTECEYHKVPQFQICGPCLGSSKNEGKDPFQTNEHLQFANLFLCGLLSKSNTSLLEHVVPLASLKKKRAVLKSYLANCVKSHLKGLPRHPSETEGRKVQVMPNFLWMLRCIFETRSDDVARLTARGISADNIKLTYCNMSSADCSALNFVLHHHRKHLGVDMDNNNISDYGVKELQPSFSKMTVVRLSVNQITDCGIEVLAEELIKHKVVKYLGLYKNGITDVGANLVAQVVEQCPHLMTLKIGCNKITSVGGKYLASAIQKSKSIFDVGMWGNSIGDEGARAFAEAIKNHPRLTNLSLSANGITSEGGRSLAAALKENESLHIFWLVQNELTDDVAADFAEAVRINKGLKCFWLIDNKFTVQGVRVLAEALPHNTSLKEICLKGNQLNAEEEKIFEMETRLHFC